MPVVVLGMHRSGTSLLIGLMEKFGFSLGHVSTKTSPLKPTGTKENVYLREINNQFLSINNCSWDKPSNELLINKNISSQMVEFSNNLEGDNWAIKDPRLLLCYQYWKMYLPQHKILATLRHPLLVAQSLKLKNNMHMSKALQLWLIYNQFLLSLWLESSFPILNFDVPIDKYFNNFKKLEPYLNIQISEQPFNEFYNHKNSGLKLNLDLYPQLNLVYQKLLKITERDNN